MSKLAVRRPAPVRVVFTGQSLNLVPLPPPTGLTYPERLMRGRGIPWQNVAISGYSWDWLEADIPIHLAPQARSTGTDILIMQGGQTGLFLGRTGSQVYANAISYATAARAVGFDKVILTTMPAMGPTGPPPISSVPTVSQWNEALAHNVLALANSGGFDAVADLYMGPLTDATDLTYYMADRLHFTAGGSQAAADLVAPALDSILP